MKLFKQKGWGCMHNYKNEEDRACQKCLRHDWWWSTHIPYYLVILFYPYWWLRYGRKMDKKGFMPDEEGYRKDRS